MFRFLRLATCLTAIALPSAGAQAQDAAELRAAEDVVRAALMAAADRNWEVYVQLLHPAELVVFKNQQVQILRHEERRGDDWRPARDTTMPPEVARWFEEQYRANRQDYEAEKYARLGVSSLQELESLTPAEAAIRFLAASDPAAMVQRSMQRSGADIPGRFDADAVMPRPQYSVLGSIAEDDSTILVIARPRLNGAAPYHGEARVIPARRFEDTWRVLAGPGLELDDSGHIHVFGVSFVNSTPSDQWLTNMANTIVKWPEQGTEQGRAYLAGLTKESRMPTGLVVEFRRDGQTMRIEIPRAAFEKLSELIIPWTMFLP